MARLLPLSLLGLVMLPGVARASAWETKTMQDVFELREVERPLIIGKGWLESETGVEVKVADGYWGPDGEALSFENARWLYTTEYTQLRYGLTPTMELWARARIHYLRLTNDLYGTDTSGWYLGDPEFGVVQEVLGTRAPLTSIVWKAALKAPAGNEAPGSYIGGPSTFTTFVTTTGTFDATLAAAGKRQLGPAAVGLEVGYVYRFSGLVQYLLETDQNQFLGRIKPGNQVKVSGLVEAQAGPVALVVEPRFEIHSEVQVGTTSEGPIPDANLEPIEGSDGWSLDVDARASFSPNRNVEVLAGATVPVRGEDLMFFPIEDLHPTRGLTWSGAIRIRY